MAVTAYCHICDKTTMWCGAICMSCDERTQLEMVECELDKCKTMTVEQRLHRLERLQFKDRGYKVPPQPM